MITQNLCLYILYYNIILMDNIILEIMKRFVLELFFTSHY